MANKGTVAIDRERCKGCGLCVASCPLKVLETEESVNSMGYYPAFPAHQEKCIACGNCHAVCPDVAITVYKE